MGKLGNNYESLKGEEWDNQEVCCMGGREEEREKEKRRERERRQREREREGKRRTEGN